MLKRTGHDRTAVGLVYAVLILLSLTLSSCTMLFKPMFDVTDLKVEKRANGYLVEFETKRKLGDVTAFLTRDNWLVITIVGGTVDFDRLRTMEPNDLISSVQVVGYKTSVQVTLKLKEDIQSCEVAKNQSGDDISIALFTK